LVIFSARHYQRTHAIIRLPRKPQLFLGHVLANVALLFFGQTAAQFQQLVEQFVDVPAAGVATLDQFFKLLGELSAGLV
jgi:hypothetical protein